LISHDPKITIFETASIVTALHEYSPQDEFQINDTIFVYEEYENIMKNNSLVDFNVNINVIKDDVSYYFQDVNVTIFR